MTAAVLAVDGGNSKTEVALVDHRGGVLGAARGPGSNHVHSDHARVMALVDSLVARAMAGASGPRAGGPTGPVADVAVLCLAGADYASDERDLAAAAAGYGWSDATVVRNDAAAVLRAGTDSKVGVALVCGAGVNCVGVGPTGRRVGFPALGDISGDWGGGHSIGLAALAAAVRAEDGRGGRTLLRDLVPRHFGFARPSSLVRALYSGRLDERRCLLELPPVVFAAAQDGDPVAGSIVDRQADELVVMAAAILRRLRLTRAPVDVVLGGGILASGYPRLIDRLADGLAAVAPRARLVHLCTAPVAGAALIGLDELGAVPSVDLRHAVDAALRGQESR